MNTERIQEIQRGCAYPDSQSVQQALLQVWNETEHELRDEVERLLQSQFSAGMIRDELQAEVERLTAVLCTIRDMPMPEQDNMLAANMRKVAAEAVRG